MASAPSTHVAKQVSFGPRPAGSAALAKTQDYILAELKSYGCTTDVDSFSSDTPAGRVAMKNILVKIPGRDARRDSARHTLRHEASAGFCRCRRCRLLHGRHAGTCPSCFARSTAATLCGLLSLTAKRRCARNGRIPTIATGAAKWPRAWQ